MVSLQASPSATTRHVALSYQLKSIELINYSICYDKNPAQT
ncbi:hypothetical protein D1AOALGA4SA_9731 [Olavius algarvensis Delta 1 endosymbiont]|nr:hypothetical protein D1AOALGA4SA_9731 [Olavius algarvensis Delta 1 endosymbiont]